MKILALEFSSAQRSVALWHNDQITGAAHDATPGREMKPFALIETALRQAGWEREAIECLAIGLGPGSYTGIRVAISLAQGWQLARSVKLLGVSSVTSIAAQVAAQGACADFSVVSDAQRGEFYLADYQCRAGQAVETTPLHLASQATVQAREQAGRVLVGPDLSRWFPQAQLVYPAAAPLARLAAQRSDFVAGEKLEPVYLRESTFLKAPPARPLPFPV